MREIRWNLSRTVQPALAVLVQEIKEQIRVTWDDEDDSIERKGLSAQEMLENELSVALLTQTWVLRLDRFPCWEIPLPRPPLAAVTQVQYVDANGATQVLSPTIYTVELPPTNGKWQPVPGRIHLAYNQSWPITRDVPNAVTVTYTAGAVDPLLVPEVAREAITLLASDLYSHRERTITGTTVNDLPIYERLVANCRCVKEFRYV